MDDLLFYARDDVDINVIIASINSDGIMMQHEGAAEGF